MPLSGRSGCSNVSFASLASSFSRFCLACRDHTYFFSCGGVQEKSSSQAREDRHIRVPLTANQAQRCGICVQKKARTEEDEIR